MEIHNNPKTYTKRRDTTAHVLITDNYRVCKSLHCRRRSKLHRIASPSSSSSLDFLIVATLMRFLSQLHPLNQSDETRKFLCFLISPQNLVDAGLPGVDTTLAASVYLFSLISFLSPTVLTALGVKTGCRSCYQRTPRYWLPKFWIDLNRMIKSEPF